MPTLERPPPHFLVEHVQELDDADLAGIATLGGDPGNDPDHTGH